MTAGRRRTGFSMGFLVTFLLLWRHHDQGNIDKKTFNWGLAYSFRGLVHDHLGNRQEGMVLEQQLRAYISSTRLRQREQHWTWCEPLRPQSPFIVTHLLQKAHTSESSLNTLPLETKHSNIWAIYGNHSHSNLIRIHKGETLPPTRPSTCVSKPRFLDDHQVGWRDSSVIKSTSCCFRGPEFGFQHPCQAAHMSHTYTHTHYKNKSFKNEDRKLICNKCYQQLYLLYS